MRCFFKQTCLTILVSVGMGIMLFSLKASDNRSLNVHKQQDLESFFQDIVSHIENNLEEIPSDLEASDLLAKLGIKKKKPQAQQSTITQENMWYSGFRMLILTAIVGFVYIGAKKYFSRDMIEKLDSFNRRLNEVSTKLENEKDIMIPETTLTLSIQEFGAKYKEIQTFIDREYESIISVASKKGGEEKGRYRVVVDSSEDNFNRKKAQIAALEQEISLLLDPGVADATKHFSERTEQLRKILAESERKDSIRMKRERNLVESLESLNESNRFKKFNKILDAVLKPQEK